MSSHVFLYQEAVTLKDLIKIDSLLTEFPDDIELFECNARNDLLCRIFSNSLTDVLKLLIYKHQYKIKLEVYSTLFRYGEYSSYQKEFIELLMDNGISLYTTLPQKNNITIGEWLYDNACSYNNIDLLKYLVENNIQSSNHDIFPRACFEGFIDIVTYLINLGINCDQLDAGLFGAYKGHRYAKDKTRQYDIINILLQNGAQPKNLSKYVGEYCINSSNSKIIDLLVEHGADAVVLSKIMYH